MCEKKICNTYHTCVYCHGKFHNKCSLVSENEVIGSLNQKSSLCCRNCACTLFPFSLVENNKLIECSGKHQALQSNTSLYKKLNYYPFIYNGKGQLCNDFNDEDELMNEINLHCKYYDLNEFNERKASQNSNQYFSILHLNCRSVKQHFSDIIVLLQLSGQNWIS